MDLHMQGRVIVVTGGSDGLGLSAALGAAREGARPVLIGRDPDRLAAAATAVHAAGGEALTISADVTRDGALESAMDQTMARFGRIDGLVNGAGVHTAGAFEEITDGQWRDDFELKLLATARGIRLALPHLRETKGSVVNILSIWAKYQDALTMPSAVFRTAGLALTNGVAKEVAADGVRVNALLVGNVRSGQSLRLAQAAGLDPDEHDVRMAADLGIPAGRVGRTQEFADVATFLLSPVSSYVTGVGLNIDGGLSPVT